jgi:hypothetical protein
MMVFFKSGRWHKHLSPGHITTNLHLSLDHGDFSNHGSRHLHSSLVLYYMYIVLGWACSHNRRSTDGCHK